MKKYQTREFVLNNLHLRTLIRLLRASCDGEIAHFILESLGTWVPCEFLWPDAGRKVKLLICRNLLELNVDLATLSHHRAGRDRGKSYCVRNPSQYVTRVAAVSQHLEATTAYRTPAFSEKAAHHLQFPGTQGDWTPSCPLSSLSCVEIKFWSWACDICLFFNMCEFCWLKFANGHLSFSKIMFFLLFWVHSVLLPGF